MITFLICIVALVAGYFTYGVFVERVFGHDSSRKTPAFAKHDGVDYVPMAGWRIFMIQFLNIAGLGPIFGAVMGAMFGPAAFIWIVIGCIFAGAVHDYLSGMLSLRHDGASISEVIGIYLGRFAKQFMRIFSVLMLVLVGAVFVTGPADILNSIVNLNLDLFGLNIKTWGIFVFIYYILATILPIDAIIGRLYPFFGAALLFMALGLLIAIVFKWAPIPEISGFASLANAHPAASTNPIFPAMFITIACGAISGFHATQSPLMARCMKSEGIGRPIFYGSMICEGIIALIWAAAAMSFWGGVGSLNNELAAHGNSAAWAVNTICKGWLGVAGGILALIGIVACPITSGDTAFRSARLTVADLFKLEQKSIRSRMLISIPLFIAGFVLTQLDFQKIWRYFGWANQTLAVITLWTVAVYLKLNGKNHWIATVPAVFMTCVTSAFILNAKFGFNLPADISNAIAVVLSFFLLIVFILRVKAKSQPQESDTISPGLE